MVEYFEHSAISQSRLKTLAYNPRGFAVAEESELYYEEKKHFLIGSGVDCLLTQSQEEFDRIYHVSNILNKPSDAIKSIINMVFDNVIDNFDEVGLITNESYKEFIIDACESHSYQNRWANETKWSKMCEAYEYWEDLKAAYGKQILSCEEHDLISQIVMSIKTNEATAPYFLKNLFTWTEFQVPIYFECRGISCKALLDMIKINSLDKTLQPIDVKTMGDYTLNFPKSLKLRRYDIQAAFYTEALKSWQLQNPEYKDYKILPFKFIVESTIDVGTPLIYTCDETLLKVGKNGIGILYLTALDENRNEIYYSKTREVLGYIQLLQLYEYYSEHGFEKSKIINENKSELSIDWSGIITT
jgi:hypothetical protein